MLRCAASLVIAAYVQVRLIPWDLRALPLGLFTMSSKSIHYSTFYKFINNDQKDLKFIKRKLIVELIKKF